MAYKVLYVEDLEPDTIISELKAQGIETIHNDPKTLEKILYSINSDISALILDFRLTSKEAKFDAPTIAQTLRTKNSHTYRNIPIILLSSEDNITGYYEDYSSQDLFDFSVTKEAFRANPGKYSNRIKSFIEAYKIVQESNFDYSKILGLTVEEYEKIDYRICSFLNHSNIKNHTYAVALFINQNIIQPTGLLINENILSARLGVCKNSPDWSNLINKLESASYSGILKDVFPRWWMTKIENWWGSINSTPTSIRRLNAIQRIEIIKQNTELCNLTPLEPTPHSKSKKFWTVCIDTNKAIDPIDGLELYRRELFPWQDKEYISINAGLEATKSLPFVKPAGKNRLKLIGEQINQNG
ncbi:MAG: hypothetical protein R3E32_06700 [Chitinophagales bacterium]